MMIKQFILRVGLRMRTLVVPNDAVFSHRAVSQGEVDDLDLGQGQAPAPVLDQDLAQGPGHILAPGQEVVLDLGQGPGHDLALVLALEADPVPALDLVILDPDLGHHPNPGQGPAQGLHQAHVEVRGQGHDLGQDRALEVGQGRDRLGQGQVDLRPDHLLDLEEEVGTNKRRMD